MELRLLKILACPKCRGELLCDSAETDTVQEGELKCSNCGNRFPIINGIPRFVELDNYASSFGYQWNEFRKEQLDSYNGTTLSADRFWAETDWKPEQLKGKWVLDVGCGAGRFLDAAAPSGCEIVGLDLSSAIDAAQENLSNWPNVHFVQASIYDLPFKEGAFDYCYCIGVIQHTPDPIKSLASLARVIKSSGELALTIYPRKIWTKLYSKYWLRVITRRMEKQRLLKLIERVMPVAFPVTEMLFRVPVLGKFFMFAIPVANYVHEKQLDRNQRYAWAVLDTFDMLSPQFDQPLTEQEASRALIAEGLRSVRRLPNLGLNLVARREFPE